MARRLRSTMAAPRDADRIRTVSFALVPPRPQRRQGAEAAEVVARRFAERRAAQGDMLAALDAAALADDHNAWVAAADRFLADLTTDERAGVERLLGSLNNAQMSSAEREAVRN